MTNAAAALEIEPIEGGFRLNGEVDLSTVERFRAAIGAFVEDATELTIDLSRCSYMGSEGIGVLVQALQGLGPGRLRLVSPSGVLMKVLDLSGLSKLPNVEIVSG